MKKRVLWSLAGVMLAAGVCAGAQEVADASEEAGNLPAGVSAVKANPDGSFKSLVVKATVEVDQGGGKGRAAKEARNDARAQCMADLSQWIKQNCDVLVSPEGYPTLVTKGEGGKDSAGVPVQLKKPTGREFTAAPGNLERVLSLLSRQLVPLHSESSETGQQTTIVMGLSQEELNARGVLNDASAAEEDSRNDRRERLRAEGPPRSLEEDAPRNPAAVKAAQTARPGEPKPSGKLADYL